MACRSGSVTLDVWIVPSTQTALLNPAVYVSADVYLAPECHTVILRPRASHFVLPERDWGTSQFTQLGHLMKEGTFENPNERCISLHLITASTLLTNMKACHIWQEVVHFMIPGCHPPACLLRLLPRDTAHWNQSRKRL